MRRYGALLSNMPFAIGSGVTKRSRDEQSDLISVEAKSEKEG
jgi:hypothetical protein